MRYNIVGNAPQLNYAIEIAAKVAVTELSVLISGESGTGKEFFSQLIHYLSPRKHKTFIAINCGAIPEGTIDSELFGHEKGAFTGAVDKRKGYFEVTDGGTIFLDEIGEMPLPTQARLLRVLENGEFIKVGSSQVQKTDVRVLAATNVKLLDAVEKGKFREDLYYRLNNVPIQVPALRERGDDILLLFRKFSQDFADKYSQSVIKLTTDASEILLKYPFPGNVRQLKNLAEQISALEIDRTIDAEKLIKYLPDLKQNRLPVKYNSEFTGEGAHANYSDRELLYKVLFDMRADIQDLKKAVFSLLQQNIGQRAMLPRVNHSHPNNMSEPDVEDYLPVIIQQQERERFNRQANASYHPEADEDEEANQPETLSLEAKEKEMIKKALIKNNNKRKHAANDLGISERTLYRKIKQYDLENL